MSRVCQKCFISKTFFSAYDSNEQTFKNITNEP